MSQEFINPSDGVIRQYLATSKTLAVVGLSDREETTSNRVTKEMQARGYKIIPVNPKVEGGEILGEKAYASLAEIPFPVDIVNVTGAVSFCRMWRVIFSRLMPRFFGHS